jgi:hypothetical protein
MTSSKQSHESDMVPNPGLATAQQEPPAIELTLKPVFGVHSKNVESLAATMRVVGLSYGTNEPLLTHPLEIYGVPSNGYDEDAM